ncbi:MAG: hypothetical protein F3743_07765 [Nitrospinae bacterium]|nr:hypothetical protein [Nitrospinota bacterium]MZH05284.1 hypothetical protein [Nitrospinota bacterium]MZH14419.1 hypothetical protein [Nitrospinota bacterium]
MKRNKNAAKLKSGKNLIMRVLGALIILGLFSAGPAPAQEKCEPLDKKQIKIEGYISKKFRKQRKAIFKEFTEMGNSKSVLRVYPMGETSKVIAIGKCVPVHIAQHVIKKAMKYSTGVESLVQQQFVHGHWIGVGVTIFDEPSQQLVSSEQVKQLLNPELSSEEFHQLYRKLSVPNELTPFFGLQVPNIKTAQPE